MDNCVDNNTIFYLLYSVHSTNAVNNTTVFIYLMYVLLSTSEDRILNSISHIEWCFGAIQTLIRVFFVCTLLRLWNYFSTNINKKFTKKLLSGNDKCTVLLTLLCLFNTLVPYIITQRKISVSKKMKISSF